MKIKRAIIIAFIVLGLMIFVSTWIAGGLLAAPVNQPVGDPPSDIPVAAVHFSSESGSEIHGWLIPGQKQAGAVVLMHGYGGDRTSMLDRARFLSRAGYTVLLFDFQ